MQNSTVAVERQIGVANPTWDLTAAGDVNGDGVADILWRVPSGAVVCWEINASAALAVERAIGSFDPAVELVDTRDLTGDGTSDIVFRQHDGSVVSWEMQNGLIAVERAVGFFDNTWQIIV